MLPYLLSLVYHARQAAYGKAWGISEQPSPYVKVSQCLNTAAEKPAGNSLSTVKTKSYLMKKIQEVTITMLSCFFVLLFIYASVSKLLEFEKFQVQLAQSPILSAYAGFVSYAVIIIEWLICIVLSFPIGRRFGLYASLLLMSAFTAYIFIILHYSDFVPCSCGGILEQLGWTEHLIFNGICVLFAVIGIILIEKKKNNFQPRKTAISVTASLILSVSLMAGLFLSSEHTLKKENNFTRRFPHHPIKYDKKYNLNYNSYYFAGYSGNKLFLGNITSPFQLLVLDENLLKTDTVFLKPDADVLYTAPKIMVKEDLITFVDGTKAVVFQSKKRDFSGKVDLISSKDIYFDQMVPVDSGLFAFRAKSSASGEQVLGTISLKKPKIIHLNDKLLKRQTDGVFDVDGKLHYDDATKRLVYVYSYRNTIITADKNFDHSAQQQTIDTVKYARIQTTTLRDGSMKILGKPPVTNRNSFVHGGMTFIQSELMGRYESLTMWNKNDIIDIYDNNSSQYWGSLYVQRWNGKKLSHFFITDRYLFILTGNEIIRYSLAQELKGNFKKKG